MVRPRLVIVVILVAVCLVGAATAVTTVLAGRDPNTIHPTGSLPERVSVCGRTWTKDSLLRQRTLDEARAWAGEAVVVATGPFAPCPSGPCTSVARSSPCDTVVFVRVGQDAYVDYALAGGP